MIEAVRRARLKGAKKAEQIHRMLEVRQRIVSTHLRVDVFDALAWLDVRVVFKPLDGLLGAYIRGDHPGVMINIRRPLSVQRFTAAHELGHAVLEHEPSLDSENVLRRAANSERSLKVEGFASYLQEIEADAFAGAFLLPNWLIALHAQKHEWSRSALADEEVVYQLALRCGASFQATVWALERNGIIDADARVRLLGIRPKQIKQRIGHVAGAAETRSDAWVLNEGDDRSDIAINVGDTVTVTLLQQAGGGYLWLPKEAAPAPLTEIETVVAVPPADVGGACARRSFYRADRQGAGRLPFEHRRPWEGEPIGEVAFNLSVLSPEHGLSRANRNRQSSSYQAADAPN